MQPLSNLSNEALLEGLRVIVGSHRRVTADLILHLAEVDARRLHLERGFSSLFVYCVEHLRFSEDEACRRIEAARLARRFPAIYALVETGALSLTVLGLLKAYLTEDNCRELLSEVSGSSVRLAKEWLAARFPRPDVPSTIRKLAAIPAMRDAGAVLAASARAIPVEPAASARAIPVEPAASARVRVELAASARAIPVEPAAPTRVRVEPLSRDSFLVKFTASRAVRDKIEQARDLMRHANPSGDMSVVLERALDLLIADMEKKKQGRTTRSHTKPPRANDAHVTRAARREVVGRDGWRCSFVARDGRRCDARGFLEFDHETPKGRGGGSGAENLRVLCRAHNRWAAERVYGEAHVARTIADARQQRAVGGSLHGTLEGIALRCTELANGDRVGDTPRT